MLHLDHMVILIPYKTLLDPPSWITENFVLSPGGRHADGKTENKLICFEDGSYIELIAFVKDEHQDRMTHFWASKSPGIIDFALTSTNDANAQFSELGERLSRSSGQDSYAEPVAGGRKRPDGVDVNWKVTFPLLRDRQRGELPFFCHDLTPRDLRVPVEKKNISHPSGAYGIKGFSIFLEKSKFPDIINVYSAIFGVENKSPTPNVGVFNLNRLHEVDGAPKPSFQVRVPVEEVDVRAMEDRSGLFLGNLVFGCHTGAKEARRIDPADGYMGGVYLDSE